MQIEIHTPELEQRVRAALLAILQSSPYPEIDLAPPRDRVPVHVRDILL